MDYKLALKEFGLNEKEITVYLALLKYGESKAVEIASKTKILRTTCYEVLNSLLEKGVVTCVVKNRVKYFYPASPDTLIDILKDKQKKVEVVLPDLKSIQKYTKSHEEVEVYKGKKGIKIVNEIVLKCGKEEGIVRSFGSFDLAYKFVKYQAVDFVKKRIKLGIQMRSVTNDFFKQYEGTKFPDYWKYSQVRIDNSLEGLPAWTYIFGDKVAYLTYVDDEFSGIIIHSKAISHTQKFFFDKLWENAKKFK